MNIVFGRSIIVLLLTLFVACGGGGGGNSGPSTSAPVISTQPLSQNVHTRSSVSLTVAANGTPTPTIAWQRSNDSGGTWSFINGATSLTYSFTPQLADNGASFRAIATNSAGQATSNSAMLGVMPAIYAGGKIYFQTGNPVFGYWFNGTWFGHTLPPGLVQGDVQGSANSLVVSGNDVYEAGTVGYTATPDAVPGYWKNSNWISLTLPINATGGVSNSLVVIGNNVYAGGSCRFSSGSIPGYWLNGTWIGLETSPLATNGFLSCLTVSAGDVYAGGYKNQVAGPTIPGYYKNGVWNTLTPPNNSSTGPVNTIIVTGVDIYVGDTVNDNALNTSIPGYWKNGTWTGMTLPFAVQINSHFGLSALAISGGDVYVASNPINTSGFNVAGFWKNGIWSSLTPLSISQSDSVNSLYIFSNDVYAGGYCKDNSSYQVPGYWVNGVWVNLSTPSNSTGGSVTALIIQQ